MPKWIPQGFHSITPRLVARDPEKLVRFLQQAFDARGEYSDKHPAQMRIGNSLVMVSGTAARTARRSLLYLYVKDVDATYERALQAGAKSLESPTVVSYGDRRAIIKDPAGNEWQVATPRAVARKSLSR